MEFVELARRTAKKTETIDCESGKSRRDRFEFHSMKVEQRTFIESGWVIRPRHCVRKSLKRLTVTAAMLELISGTSLRKVSSLAREDAQVDECVYVCICSCLYGATIASCTKTIGNESVHFHVV